MSGLNDVSISPEIDGNYTVIDNSFIIDYNNEKDFISTEIGDTKQPSDFHPQIKVSRWDNEVNVSVRLIEDALDVPVVTTEKEKIKYDKAGYSATFYDLAMDSGFDGGGYEFEITLKEKPVSNVIRFSLKTKGVKFCYQGELTLSEIQRGHSRPENIVGSYAIYYDNTPLNIVGGKEYKTGKMGHIYRPEIVDSKGVSVWGSLHIDAVTETLTVTIPQEFIDSATYPVYHAAGFTFGYTSIGGTTGGSIFNTLLAHPRYVGGNNGEADSVSIYFVNVGAGAKVTAGFYLAPSGYPTDLVGGTSELTVVTNTWNVLNLAQEAVDSATWYRIGFQGGGHNSSPKYDSSSGDDDYYQTRTYTAGSMPDPYTAGGNNEGSFEWSSYVTFSEAVAPTAKPKIMWIM